MLRALAVVIFLYASTEPALALCRAPWPPDKPRGAVPSRPFCEIHSTGYDRCDTFDIEMFRSEVEDYLADWQRYADEALRFANDALAYAKCNAGEAVDEWNEFVAGY